MDCAHASSGTARNPALHGGELPSPAVSHMLDWAPFQLSTAGYRIMRLLVLVLSLGCLALPSWAGETPAESGVVSVDTEQTFDGFVARLEAAVRDNGMDIAAGSCGSCGIRSIAILGRTARIITVYRPDLMMRMLKAGAAVGAEPPLRFYVSRLADGTARLTYHRPSGALALYARPALQDMGEELDAVFAKIVHDATK